MNLILCHQTTSVPWQAATLAIGHFDGVHLGHRKVILEAVHDARRHGRPTVVVTFDRNPLEVLRPEDAPPYLCTLRQRLERFETLGVDHTVLLIFDKQLASQPWLEFAEGTLRDWLHCKHLVVGHDFRFGQGRLGTPEAVHARREELGFDATAVPALEHDGRRVSSTEIRLALQAGRLDQAERALGRPYSLVGTVVHGDKRGRTFGYPTLNLVPVARLVVPSDGVYAGTVHVGPDRWKAAVSIGVRPTVGGGQRTIEAHLLDYPGDDLYGRTVTLTFLARLREERAFPNTEQLRVQMDEDVRQCRALLDV
ncbi:MAG: bifunctional riboflavin kinase/FAD synthetase [Fimbriimonadia bacterium]|jgi:riboflavin kinase/FMN adenylyltransferase